MSTKESKKEKRSEGDESPSKRSKGEKVEWMAHTGQSETVGPLDIFVDIGGVPGFPVDFSR